MKTVVGGDPVQKRRMTLWVVAGIILVALSIVGGVVLLMTKGQPGNEAQPAAAAELPASASKAQDLAASGDYAAAHKQITDTLSKPGLSNSDKYALYYQQGVTYQNENKPQQAIDSFKQAEAIQATQSLETSIGDSYVQLGDKTQAIAYYRKAIDLIPTAGNPVAGDDKSALEQKISDLGGQQ
ncbi:MAG TPA: tetratricopeptide repeat protein [Patescibacteria group bacterium]|nr:tetratricopeptide repeat protein [Patescibacteria group bacterium]